MQPWGRSYTYSQFNEGWCIACPCSGVGAAAAAAAMAAALFNRISNLIIHYSNLAAANCNWPRDS